MPSKKPQVSDVSATHVIDVDGNINEAFVGVDPDMAGIIDAVSVNSMTKLTAVKGQAAELLADVLQPERVDAILCLSKGTVRGWLGEEAFMSGVVSARRAKGGRVESAYEAALTEPQCCAANLEALGVRKVRIAEALGCHRSTLHNWGRDPVYQRLVARYRSEIMSRRAEARLRIRDRELNLAHDAIRRGLREGTPQGAARIGLAVVKHYDGQR